jgi:hypothetical protein
LSLHWNTLSNRSILPEMICQEKTQLPSKFARIRETAKATDKIR